MDAVTGVVPPYDSHFTVDVLFAEAPPERRAREVLAVEFSAAVTATPNVDAMGYVSVGPVSDRNAQEHSRA